MFPSIRYIYLSFHDQYQRCILRYVLLHKVIILLALMHKSLRCWMFQTSAAPTVLWQTAKNNYVLYCFKNKNQKFGLFDVTNCIELRRKGNTFTSWGCNDWKSLNNVTTLHKPPLLSTQPQKPTPLQEELLLSECRCTLKCGHSHPLVLFKSWDMREKLLKGYSHPYALPMIPIRKVIHI